MGAINRFMVVSITQFRWDLFAFVERSARGEVIEFIYKT